MVVSFWKLKELYSKFKARAASFQISDVFFHHYQIQHFRRRLGVLAKPKSDSEVNRRAPGSRTDRQEGKMEAKKCSVLSAACGYVTSWRTPAEESEGYSQK